jgi:hypothetical protein
MTTTEAVEAMVRVMAPYIWFQSLGAEHLDPSVHATFILAHGLAAGGAHRQLQLLES